MLAQLIPGRVVPESPVVALAEAGECNLMRPAATLLAGYPPGQGALEVQGLQFAASEVEWQ